METISMRKAVFFLAVVLTFIFMSSVIPARADSIKLGTVRIIGSEGGQDGYHVVTVGNTMCRLKNSTGFSAPKGCNYILKWAGVVDADGRTKRLPIVRETSGTKGCSSRCEQYDPRQDRNTPASAGGSPAADASGFRLGIQVRAVTAEDVATLNLPKPKGIVIMNVEKGGMADVIHMQNGDVILEVNSSEIGDAEFFTQFVRSGAAKSFRVWRKGQAVELTVPQSI